MSTTSTNDKPRLLYDQYHGQRGPLFEAWRKPFLDAAEGKGDDDASYAECYLGTDPQGGLTAAQVRRRAVRRRESYAMLIQHMTDESLKAVIRAEAGPNAPNPIDQRNGRTAWLTLVRECSDPASTLQTNTRIAEFNALTILKDVGISESTITDFNRLLISKNADLPAGNQFSPDFITEKILGAVTVPATLATICDGLLQCTAADRPARLFAQAVPAIGGGPAVPAGWLSRAVVAYLDELWRASFRRGDGGLRFTSPTARPVRQGPSTRADGMFASEEAHVAEANADDNGSIHYAFHAACDPIDLETDEGFTAACDQAMSAVVSAALNNNDVEHIAEYLFNVNDEVAAAVLDAIQNELLCYNCLGFAHRAADCPSPKIDRKPMIDRLITLVTNMKNRPPRFGKGRGGKGNRAFGGVGRGRGRGSRVSFGRPMPPSRPWIRPAGPPDQVMSADVLSATPAILSATPVILSATSATPNVEVPSDAQQDPAGEAAVTEDMIDDVDIFGEPVHPGDEVANADDTTYADADVIAMYNHLVKTGYSASEARVGARNMTQNVITPPGATLEYYEHEKFVYPDERAGYFTYMGQRWRNRAQLKTMRETVVHSDYYGARPPSERVRLPAAGIKAAIAGVIMVSLAAALVATRRCMPSPTRLATLLMVAGAHTTRALAPPWQPAMRADMSHATTAAMSVAAGVLLARPLPGYPDVLCAAGHSFIDKLPTDFALMLSDGHTGQLKNVSCDFLVDSGATSHMVDTETKLTRITSTLPNRTVRVANGTIIPATHIGDMDVPVTAMYKYKTNKVLARKTVMTLTNVLVVPGLSSDLLSCNAAFDNDSITTHLNDERALGLPDGGRVPFVEGDRRKNILRTLAANENASVATDLDGADLLHARLAHMSPDRIAMARALFKGEPLPPDRDMRAASHDCEACGLGGSSRPHISHRRPIQKAGKRDFNDSVHVDLCGPFPPSAQTGFRYVIGFADRGTRVVSIYFLTNKTSESVKHAIETYVADTGKVREFVFDNGGEFTAPNIDTLLAEMMSSRRFSVPWTPQRNGLIERFWGTLVRHTRILLAASGHSEALWPFAMSHVTEIHNSLPTRALEPPMAPYQAKNGKPPSLKAFAKGVWGCDCIINLPHPKDGTKLSPTGVKANYLGQDVRRHGEYYFIPSLNKIMSVVRAYKYFPSKFTQIALTPAPIMAIDEPRNATKPWSAIGNHAVVPAMPTTLNMNIPIVAAMPINVIPDQGAMALAEPPAHLPSTATSFSSSFVDDCYAADVSALVSNALPAPKDHREIAGRPDEAIWRKAELDDFEAKMRNGAFEIMDVCALPPGARPVKSKYAYSNKYDPITKFLMECRARLVGCGYSQVEGVNFTADRTASGTMRGSTVRALMCTAAIDDLDIFTGDVKKAFTQTKLDHEVYLLPPPSLHSLRGKVLKAKMSIEGLVQSGWLFQTDAYAQIKKLGGVQSLIDPNVFVVTVEVDNKQYRLLVGLWVDDFLILAPRGRQDVAEKFWAGFRQRFECKDLVTDPKVFIGLEIARDRQKRTLTLTQSSYIDAMFEKFMHGSDTKLWTKLWTSPLGNDDEDTLAAFTNLAAGTEDEQRIAIDKGYMSIVGSILYASAMTRPDIAFHTSSLAKLLQCPSLPALDAALGIVSYLKRTRKLGLTYGPDDSLRLYTDSSWGGNPRPMAGYVSIYGGAGLSWAAKMLKIVPLSSAEAETAVLSLGCKDAMFVAQLLAELRPRATKQIVIDAFVDNTAAIELVKSHGASGRTRHFERWITYVRDLYQRSILTVKHVSTHDMPADIFTKPLPYLVFTKFRHILLGM